jgi:hypothetical protein
METRLLRLPTAGEISPPRLSPERLLHCIGTNQRQWPHILQSSVGDLTKEVTLMDADLTEQRRRRWRCRTERHARSSSRRRTNRTVRYRRCGRTSWSPAASTLEDVEPLITTKNGDTTDYMLVEIWTDGSAKRNISRKGHGYWLTC